MKNSDEAVERVLAALRDAKAPEGLEERIAARLAVRGDVGFRWREVFGGSAVAGVWWRGVLSGLAAAMLVMGVVWLAGGFARGPVRSGEVVVRERVVAAPVASVSAPVREEVRSVPCASAPRVVREPAVAERRELVRVAQVEMGASHPAPAMGLTPQERELVQLARTGDAKDLAALDPETRARAEAKDAAEFQKFFAEPVRGDNPPAPEADNQ